MAFDTFRTWITNGTASPFLARKNFTLDRPIAKAEAKVCGLGQFVFWLNGTKVGDHELDPGWTDYRKYVQYVSFDVTSLLRPGENAMGFEVGNGWYIKTDEHYTFAFPPFMPPNPNPYVPFGDALVLAAEITVTYQDGTTEVISADDACKAAPHPITMSNVYGSETYDAALEQPGWCTASFDDASWSNALPGTAPAGELKEQLQPAIKVIKTYPGKRIGTVNGRDIYDLGQNISGILELTYQGKPGEIVRLYPAEKLTPDGDVDQQAKGWLLIDSCITCICSGGIDHYRMKFTYFAGRFFGVDHGDVAILDLTADAVTSAWKRDGSFVSDDDRYNKIYDMIEKTVEANMVSVHTDCPTIERFAWQEPNHLMAPAIFFMKDGSKLWEKFLLDIRAAQHTAEDRFKDFAGNEFCPGDGLVPSQCPCYIPNVLPVPGMGSFYDIIPWGSTSILGVYWHYCFYGDLRIVRDNYDCGMRYLNYLKTRVNEEGFINHGLGDWGNPRNELARENIETAFLYADTTTLAYFADLLGKDEDKAALDAYAAEIKANYNAKLLVQHPTESFLCYKSWDHPDDIYLTQASQALPLFWSLVPEDKRIDVVKALRWTLERDGAFICGEVGLPYVIQAAREAGMNDLIASFITRTEHPSYYAFILDGETTLGEYWENNPRSHCHDMMGHIIEWYYDGIAGIQPLEPGFAKILVQPYLPEGMHAFTCTYQSVHGEIKVQVQKDGTAVQLNLTVPEGVDCELDSSNLTTDGSTVSAHIEKV